MFERFTHRARQVMVIAQEEARGLGHPFIGTEHLLLGLLKEGEGVGAKALLQCGVSLAETRAKVLELVQRGAGPVPDRPPFTPRAKKVLEMSLREALSLGHNYIGTEHILLGVIREADGVGAHALKAMGVELDEVKAKVTELLGGYSPSSQKRTIVQRVRRQGGPPGRITPGELLALLADEPDAPLSHALSRLGVTPATLATALADDPTPVYAPEPPIEIRIGTRHLVIDDEDIISRLSGLSDDELHEELRRLTGEG